MTLSKALYMLRIAGFIGRAPYHALQLLISLCKLFK
jgi:hypothetical protein